jgi:hypothetical protein
MAFDETKLDAMIENEVAENEQVKQFILTNKGKHIEVEVFGLKLQVPSVIPKKLRHELAKVQKKGEVDIEVAEEDTYHLLSLMCQNEPFNHKEAWALIDEETGLAIEILGEVLEVAYKTEEKTKSFRGK